MADYTKSLHKKVIAVPESRQLDRLAQLLEKRSAQVRRIPLISIHDSPHTQDILSWMESFIANPPELLIIFTGEGVRRLISFANNNELFEAFCVALNKVTKLCRGPKPNQALREIGLSSDIQALEPTTDGIIKTLDTMNVKGMKIGLQLYGDDPNEVLMEYLQSRDTEILTVAPYIYADAAEKSQVLDLIHSLNNGEIDAIAFTSQPQFKRLLQVAKSEGLNDVLRSGLEKVRVAVIGPLVKAQLVGLGINVHIMPERAFFMKPLVTAIMKDFASH